MKRKICPKCGKKFKKLTVLKDKESKEEKRIIIHRKKSGNIPFGNVYSYSECRV